MKKLVAFWGILFILHPLVAQDSATIYKKLQQLNFLGSVLYVGAHPDDENTRMISYFANHLHARTAYLSLTRGDGGQNLIGTELREGLGLIRTQELLEARKIDGGQQFFTTANDFGYSKHPDETLRIWDKAALQAQVVDRIRAFKPDVIINRFNHRTPGSTHGHHTTSALLSVEAFDLAADTNFKTKQPYTPWQVKKLFFNTSWWFYGSREKFEEANKQNLVQVDVGRFDNILGVSNASIAAQSRSQHKSQGFGSTAELGSSIEYLELLQGTPATQNDPFEGIDTTWNRLEGGATIGEKVNRAIAEFDFTQPERSLPLLVDIYTAIQQLKDAHWKTIKSQEVKALIIACGGWDFAFYTTEEYGTPHQSLSTKVRVVNPGKTPLQLEDFTVENQSFTIAKNAAENQPVEVGIKFTTPSRLTVPYWLTQKGSLGMYRVDEPQWIGRPETPALEGTLTATLLGTSLDFTLPLTYRTTDPVAGEVIQPYHNLPEITVALDKSVYLLTNQNEVKISATLSLRQNTPLSGSLSLALPENWTVSPRSIPFSIAKKGAEQRVEFTVSVPENNTKQFIAPLVKTPTGTYNHTLTLIDYPHITKQFLLQPAEAAVVKLALNTPIKRIGYIQGAGDKIPEALRNVGIAVDEISVDALTPEWMQNYPTVVLGIRSFNVGEAWSFKHQYLWDYVAQGGTVVVQYNTSRGLKSEAIGPYPLQLSRDRVTDEQAPIELLDANHPLFNYPNKLTQKDFEGWVQERGLYFAGQWDAQYTPLLSLNDPGESPKKGALLVADHGKGKFIFTGLSLFRQLPEGVPGAYRLLVNLISYH